MGMRSLFPAFRSVSPRSLRFASRRRNGALAVGRAATAAIEPLERRVLFAVITATPTTPATVTTGSTEDVIVTYVDPNTTSTVSGFAGSNLTVTPPVGVSPAPAVTLPITPTVTAGTATATYVVTAPGGGVWTSADNGTYTVGLNAGVADAASDAVTPNASLTLFTVDVAASTAPTATVTSAPNVTSAATSTTKIVVTYASASAEILASTVGIDNITVEGPSPSTATLTIAAITPATPANAATELITYTVDAPGGTAWSMADDGTYTIGVVGNVTDNSTPTPLSVAANPAAGTFTVNAAAAAAPTATVTSAPNVTSTATSTTNIVVTYASASAEILASTVGINNITVKGPSPSTAALTIAAITPATPINAATELITYTVDAPGGTAWSAADDGTFTIGVVGNVTDNSTPTPLSVAANPAAATFTVNAAAAGAPTATVTSAPNVTSAATSTTNIVVTYASASAEILASTVGIDNITVEGPSPSTATLTIAAITPATPINAATDVITYTVDAPGGTAWSAADDGTYTIGVVGNVTDNSTPTPLAVAANPAAATFTVNASVPGAPTATVTSAPDVTSAATSSTNIVVTYASTVAQILGSTLGTDNITVENGSGTPLTIASTTPATFVNAATEVVTYTVDAPGGTPWSIADDGTYTVGIVSNVTDNSTPTPVAVAANPSAATFTVNVADAPTAVLTQPATITTPGGSTEAIVVTYSDPGAALSTPVLVEGSSIATDNISVMSPNATTVSISAVSPVAPADGSPLVVTYTASLPAGETWNAALNGTYTIELNDTVTNTDGNAITANPTFGTFSVSLNDLVHPTASVNAPPLEQSIGSTHQIVVTYVDNAAMSTASVNAVGTSAITVVDNTTGETLDVVNETIAAGTPDNPATLQVTYTVEQPDGENFTAADNGIYTIDLIGSPPVTDLSGNAVLPVANLGTFDVAIGDTSRPTGTPTANEVTSNGINGETITFVLTDDQDINVSTINLNSISVFSPSGAALSPKSLSLSTTVNAQTVTAIYVVAPPNGQAFRGVDNGTYDVSLNGVTDVAGLAVLPSSVSTTFTVDVQEPQTPVYEGQFGIFNGKEHKLRFDDVPAGTFVTISGRGGQGNVYQEGDGSLTMTLNDFGGGLNVTVQTSSGRPIDFHNVVVNGSINNFQSLTGNLEGTFQVSGTLTKATFRQLVSGNVVATGPILNLRVLRAVTGSQILSGVLFGADGIFGVNPNTLIDDDTYAPGYIGNVYVGGAFANSVVAAGADPGADDIFGFNQITQTDDDVRAGTSTSLIEHVTAAAADALTRFEAGHYGTFKFGKVRFFPNPATDSRFKGL